MREITKEIGYNSDYTDVENIKLTFTSEMLDKIKESVLIVRDPNTPMNETVIWFYDAELLQENGEVSTLRTDGGELKIFKDSIYYATCSKHDSSYMIESKPIEVSEIFGDDGLKEAFKYAVIKLEERNGNFEYIHTSLHTLPLDADLDKEAELYTKLFFDGNEDPEELAVGVYWDDCMERAIQLFSVTEVTKSEFDVLNKVI